jgi:serine/threonine protein kinase
MTDLLGQRLGEYEVVALLGRGGMAAVYQAKQSAPLQRDVAIKVVKPTAVEAADFVKRFEREAQIIASLSHPHIVKIFDYGQQGETVYLVMELLRGGSLRQRLKGGPLDLAEAARFLDQIASALDYAHQKGIVHRDLKPQNVLLDETGSLLLTDFGIAKALDETTGLTHSGKVMGTPSYMAPEQWQGQSIDGRADVYALGVMLFEMLGGEVPFKGDTPFTLMYMHLNDPPPSLRSLRADIPAEIEQVVKGALAK